MSFIQQAALGANGDDRFPGNDLLMTGEGQMATGPRFGSNGELSALVGVGHEALGSADQVRRSREVDERTAVYLLSLARELLRRDHSAIAGMIDYAIAEIEGGPDDVD